MHWFVPKSFLNSTKFIFNTEFHKIRSERSCLSRSARSCSLRRSSSRRFYSVSDLLGLVHAILKSSERLFMKIRSVLCWFWSILWRFWSNFPHKVVSTAFLFQLRFVGSLNLLDRQTREFYLFEANPLPSRHSSWDFTDNEIQIHDNFHAVDWLQVDLLVPLALWRDSASRKQKEGVILSLENAIVHGKCLSIDSSFAWWSASTIRSIRWRSSSFCLSQLPTFLEILFSKHQISLVLMVLKGRLLKEFHWQPWHGCDHGPHALAAVSCVANRILAGEGRARVPAPFLLDVWSGRWFWSKTLEYCGVAK